MADKNQAIIDYMLTCPAIANNPVYFNAIQAKDNNKELMTLASDKNTHTPYIDGSVSKRYTFTLIDFKSISYNPLVGVIGTSAVNNENVQDMLDVQGIMDWITEQNELRNFPNFGTDCVIDEIKTVTENPNLNGIQDNLTPALAKYSFSVQVDYIDNSKCIY